MILIGYRVLHVMFMKTIVVSGSPGKDLHVKIDSVEKLPQPFKKYLKKTVANSKIAEAYGPEWNLNRVFSVLKERSVQPFHYSYGGRGPNVAYGSAKLGGDIQLVTVFGDDYDKPYSGFFDGGYWSHLKRAGVKMGIFKVEFPNELWRKPDELQQYIERTYGPSIYDADAVQVAGKETSTIVCCKDVQGIDWYYIDDINGAGYFEAVRPPPREIIRKADIVFVDTSEAPFMVGMVKYASQLGKEIVMDVGSYNVTSELLSDMIPKIRIVLGNANEIGLVREAFGVQTPQEIFQASPTNFPQVIVLEDKIQCTAKVLLRSGEEIDVGPVKANKIGNSVGCCDGIAAGFLTFYQRGFDIETCVRAGMIICAIKWEAEGVHEGMPDKLTFQQRFEAQFGSEYSRGELAEIRRALGFQS